MRSVLRLVPLVLLLTSAGASAQSARLSGVIVDPSGAVLPGVDVRAALTSGQTQTPNRAVTDGSGRYEFRLPPGQYALTTSLPGFASTEVTVTVADADVARNIELRVGSLQETITIVAGAAPPAAAPRRTAPVAAPTVAPSSPTSGARPGPPPPPPARTSPTPVRVGGSLKPPQKTLSVSPIYPPALAAQGVGGTVVLEATIGPDGHVRDIRSLRSPNEELTKAASDAMMQWEFTPTLLNGAPIAVIMTGTFSFITQ